MWAHKVKKVAKWLRVADNVVEALFYAREGSMLERGLAIASATGNVLDLIVSERAPQQILKASGFHKVKTPLATFLAQTLHDSDLTYDTTNNFQGESDTFVWEEQGIAALRGVDGEWLGLFSREDVDVFACLRPLVWAEKRAVLLSVSEGADSETNFHLQPLEDAGAFLGTPSAPWVANRLKLRGSSTKSLLIVGLSGSGKSTLARHVSDALEPDARTVKFANSISRHCGIAEIVDLAKLFNPTVLLLDDVQEIGHSSENSADMLEIYEALRGKVSLIIGTWMQMTWGDQAAAAVQESVDQIDGSLHMEDGFRPGRVDEVIYLPPSDDAAREEILTHYAPDVVLPDTLVAQTKGLTGAYLMEIATRLRVFGVEHWEEEVKRVRAMAPRTVKKAKKKK